MKLLAQRTKGEISKVESKSLVGVKVNGVALAIADKMVDILIASGATNGTLSVAGKDVAVTGLAALAYKAQISEADLDTALKAVLDGKASGADHGIIPNRNAGQYGCPRADPNVVPNLNWLCHFQSSIALLRIDCMLRRGKAAIRRNEYMVAKGYFGSIRNHKIVVGVEIIPN